MGVFLVAAAAAIAVFEMAFFAQRKAKLPTRTDAGYNEKDVAAQTRTLNLMVVASALFPVLLYAILFHFVPDIGAQTLF